AELDLHRQRLADLPVSRLQRRHVRRRRGAGLPADPDRHRDRGVHLEFREWLHLWPVREGAAGSAWNLLELCWCGKRRRRCSSSTSMCPRSTGTPPTTCGVSLAISAATQAVSCLACPGQSSFSV
ncbi:unnamed protein product, partial [Prorocentrum cordatum]